MGQAIEYQKLMTEVVYINLPGPKEPIPGMGGGDLLHGFLGELYTNSSVETKKIIDSLSQRWNVRFREGK